MSTLKMSSIICMAEIVLINKYHLIVSHLVMLLHSLGFNILTIFNNISTIFVTQAITTCGAFSQQHNFCQIKRPCTTWSSVISWCCSTLLASISEISLFISSFSPWVVKHSDSDDDYNEDHAQWIASCPHPHILRKNALDDGLKWHISEGYDDHLLDIKTSLPWISRIRPALEIIIFWSKSNRFREVMFLAKIKPL